MKTELSALSAKLLELHKELLNFQTRLIQEEDGRQYQSFELWNLTTKDLRFAWLRQLTTLIVQLDMMVAERNDEEIITDDQLFKLVEDFFNAQDSDFALNYQMALHTNPYLTVYDVDIHRMLKALAPKKKGESN